MGHKVTQAWLVIGVDDDGDEALAYAMMPGQMPRPMITTDLAGRASMWAAAHELAKNTGAELRLVRCEFLHEEDVIPGPGKGLPRMSDKGKVTNFKDLKILPIEDSEIQIIEWCPGDNATNPPEQVHVLIRLPFENMGFGIRLKTRAAATRFLNTLRKHINNVWPPQ